MTQEWSDFGKITLTLLQDSAGNLLVHMKDVRIFYIPWEISPILYHVNDYAIILCIWTITFRLSLWPRRSCSANSKGASLIPLSQLAPDRFKTVCDRKFSISYVLSLPLHDASHLFYARKWSHQVASDFWTCLKFRGNTWRFKLLHWVSRTFAQRCTTLC